MLAAIGGTTVAFSVAFVAAYVRGLALSYLWLWFVVPLGVSAISTAQAFGIALIVGYLTESSTLADAKAAEEFSWRDVFIYAVVKVVFTSGSVLLAGWAARTWFL